jgi:hypothetical protein
MAAELNIKHGHTRGRTPEHEATANTRRNETDHPIVWGAEEIARVIGRSPRQAHYMLTNGEIKCAQRKGSRWVAGRAALLREFGG